MYHFSSRDTYKSVCRNGRDHPNNGLLEKNKSTYKASRQRRHPHRERDKSEMRQLWPTARENLLSVLHAPNFKGIFHKTMKSCILRTGVTTNAFGEELLAIITFVKECFVRIFGAEILRKAINYDIRFNFKFDYSKMLFYSYIEPLWRCLKFFPL